MTFVKYIRAALGLLAGRCGVLIAWIERLQTAWRPRRLLCVAASLATLLPGIVVAQRPRPKLVLVVVIDQFRADYLTRFSRFFGNGGFNLFLRRGASFTARYEHANTFTCPGHAVVLTGSYAEVNGIVSNRWYDQNTGRAEYCAADSSASLLGVEAPGRSPRNLIDSTVGDVLKRATGGRSRVITISGKDRAAIMLGGHLADAAYWMQDTLVTTSAYYEKELPGWVGRFNASKVASSYLGKTWTRVLPESAYAVVGPDEVAAEQNIGGMGRTFPHRPVRGWTSAYLMDAFESSPYHNEVLARFAMEAVINEGLGQHQSPDLLAIGFSANDLIGHAFGPDSHEVMDVTVRTDRLLEQLFSFLDQRVGLANVVMVLTSDHGVAPLPELMQKREPEAGAARFEVSKVTAAVEAQLQTKYGPADRSGWIVNHDFPFVYLNLRSLRQKRVPVAEAEAVARSAVEGVAGVERATTATELERQRRQGLHSGAERSFYPGRSGNVFYELKRYHIPETQAAGTTHGSFWPYDTDVPLLWFGAGIIPGTYPNAAAVVDVAPTLSAILGVPQPSGSEGRVLREILR
jgi:predicted AlkP superfamily pyrophosphatase or phosphodiesterase